VARFKRLETLAGRVSQLERLAGAGVAAPTAGEQQQDEQHE